MKCKIDVTKRGMRKSMKLLTLSIVFGAVLLSFWMSPSFSFAQRRGDQVQEVSFDEMSLKGEVRNPQGSYLVQKRGIKFLPLYDMQKNFDQKIRRSVNYLKK